MGILVFAILSSLNAVELSQIIPNCSTNNCKITTNYDDITNSGDYGANGNEGLTIEARIGTFTNYGKISVSTSSQQTFTFKQNGYIEHLINYGTFDNLDKMGIWVDNTHGLVKITNYGIMGSIDYGANSNRITTILTLNSLGLIGAKQHHLKVMNGSKILIQNYSVMINEMASTFNSFSGLNDKTNNFSHLVIEISSNNGSITFKDGDSINHLRLW